MRLRTPHFLVAIALLVVGGAVHGMWTHRWSEAAATHAGIDLLSNISEPLGDWRPDTLIEVPPKEIPKGTTVVCRQFVNEKANKRAVVSITSGVPGIVAAHTPDVCFLGSGYKLKGPPSKQTLPMSTGGSVSYYVADFEKTSAAGSEAVRCRWAWTADGAWQAPEYPRLFFARSQVNLPVLYKLYIVHPLGDEDLTKNDAYRTFAADLPATLGRQFAR
jgi:hypothetical protein